MDEAAKTIVDMCTHPKKPFGYEGQSFVFYWWFVGWRAIQLGVSIELFKNTEIHLPFGFIRIGKP